MISYYRFPASTVREHVDGMPEAHAQARKVISEALELFEETKRLPERRREMIVECLDVIHACETLLRRESDPVEIAELTGDVIAKNEARGYYS